jgi:ribosomal protein L36
MYSLFQHNKAKEHKANARKAEGKERTSNRTIVGSNDAMYESANFRIQQFNRDVTPQLQESKEKIVMRHGAVPLICASEHKFRQRSLCPNVYVRR